MVRGMILVFGFVAIVALLSWRLNLTQSGLLLPVHFNVSFGDLFEPLWRFEVIETDLAMADDIAKPRYSILDNSLIVNPESDVIGIMIENHPDSRSQMHGLGKASIVYEALAEGGITRFLAFFSYQDLDWVGPVRSARPYYVRIAEEYADAYAHAGGSDSALEIISNSDLINLEGLYYEELGKYFYRDRNYFAPHNLFANLIELKSLVAEKKSNRIEPESFFDFGEINVRPDLKLASTINVKFSYHQFEVDYKYDPITKKYQRFLAGQPHIDHIDNQQIAASNVLIFKVPYEVIDDYGRLKYYLMGKGPLWLFRSGVLITGNWQKDSGSMRMMFFDEKGKNLPFERGQIWVGLIEDVDRLNWK